MICLISVHKTLPLQRREDKYKYGRVDVDCQKQYIALSQEVLVRGSLLDKMGLDN